MLTQISSFAPTHTATEHAVDLLTDCHRRIRHFTALAAKLAHSQAASNKEISDAAAAVHRYFSVALPLHEADEEQTLRPRLAGVGAEKLDHAVRAMSDQHMAIDELLERLLPLLLLVRSNPEVLHAAGTEMCSIAKALDEMFQAHLQMEEEVIFPAVRSALPESVQQAMLDEMKERRRHL